MPKYAAGFYHPLESFYDPEDQVNTYTTFYCQTCGTVILRDDFTKNNPCWRCGSALLARQPKLLSVDGWKLTESDLIYLRVERISSL